MPCYSQRGRRESRETVVRVSQRGEGGRKSKADGVHAAAEGKRKKNGSWLHSTPCTQHTDTKISSRERRAARANKTR